MGPNEKRDAEIEYDKEKVEDPSEKHKAPPKKFVSSETKDLGVSDKIPPGFDPKETSTP